MDKKVELEKKADPPPFPSNLVLIDMGVLSYSLLG